MKKSFKLFTILCFLPILLQGCGKTEQPKYRAVTGVDIAFQHEDMLLTRYYTDDQKMESVLLYLRLVRPTHKPQNLPDLSGNDVYRITIYLSDGNTKQFYQAQHRYLIRPDRSWTTIDPGQASQLYKLMRHYPSDTKL